MTDVPDLKRGEPVLIGFAVAPAVVANVGILLFVGARLAAVLLAGARRALLVFVRAIRADLDAVGASTLDDDISLPPAMTRFASVDDLGLREQRLPSGRRDFV
jgi:hypothetical protein